MTDKTFFISFKNLYNTELDRPIFHDDDHDKKKKLILDVLLGSNLKTSRRRGTLLERGSRHASLDVSQRETGKFSSRAGEDRAGT